MKDFLIRIPQKNESTAAAFEEVLVQFHESGQNGKLALSFFASGQNVGLYFSADESVAELFSGLLYSAFPDVDIVEKQAIYPEKIEQGSCLGIDFGLSLSDLYPLKDYTEFKGDSLSPLLSVLSKCNPAQQIFVQLVLSPVRDSAWHHVMLIVRKKIERLFRFTRIKYWFKKEAASKFDDRISRKLSQRLFSANLRCLMTDSAPGARLEPRLEAVSGALGTFNTVDLNQFRARRVYRSGQRLADFSAAALRDGFLLCAGESASLFHLPKESEVPNVVHVLSRRVAPSSRIPVDRNDPEITFFGTSVFRNQNVPFGILRGDRRRHLYTLGKSGTGKSKLMELLIGDDLRNGRGVGVLDPHGDLVDNVLKLVPPGRVNDVVLFDPSDLEYPPAFNLLEQVPARLKLRVAISFVEIFKKLFGANWTARLEHVLRYTVLALLDSPNTTVLSILKMLTDKNYRQGIVAEIQDNVVKNFWVREFASWSKSFDAEAITPLLNKVGQFVATDLIRNIVGQPRNLIDIRKIMDERKILLMKISKGVLGEENAALLGAMAITRIYQAAMARAEIAEEKRVDFYLYVDEFQNFATETFEEILSESRKYRLNLTLANQFLSQLDEHTRSTVFGNVGSLISFCVSGDDAALLCREFAPSFSAADLINLDVRSFCTKISVNGQVTEAFSGRTLEAAIPKQDQAAACLRNSRAHYARPLAEVRRELEAWEEGRAVPVAGPASRDTKKFEEPLV